MRLTYTCSGPPSPCSALLAVLFGFLCYLSTEAFPEVRSPKIKETTLQDKGKDGAVISCKADPGFPDDFTLIYWLVNTTFVEVAYPGGRIHEAEEKTIEENGQTLIQRDLVFKKDTEEDYRTNYTCVVTSPAGIAKTTFRLPRKNTGKPTKGRAVIRRWINVLRKILQEAKVIFKDQLI